MNVSPHINVAIRAARAAGREAMMFFKRRHELNIETKQKNDFVTQADTTVEKEILYQLHKAYPQYGILAEESRHETSSTGWRWIVDPIDGTTNFIHGLPHFAISIALANDHELHAAVIFNPATDELFTAERGRGAFLNGQRLRTTQNHRLDQCLLATGLPVNHPERLHRQLQTIEALVLGSRGIRRLGSAALDLAFVAAGRYDGFWEPALQPWDIAAGILLVTEAGGLVTDFAGNKNILDSGNILAASPQIHRIMLATIQPAWS
ncbi:MAG: inositol monophosphatase [Magnetococcales bacterium]|nr:inositol monophosphatase [Magnetococcales bacterium]MBF0149276.1 inositol monophosphatase [Magnetococcales bacterium]MBF0172808.1 inositol monophosphatase [Magnetococcales bacterium]MBF0348018.1 inositol monophosphatase [Magnetococcales bacterium]MBF0632184.1 inositol monophosphatase [Magnetococcales bacterium]